MSIRKISLDLDEGTYTMLKLDALEQRTTMSKIIRKAILEEMENGTKPIN